MANLNLHKIYYASCQSDNTVLIAMDIKISENQKTISWLDTVKERITEIESIEENDPGYFVFKIKENGQIYTFIPMTLEIFREKVKDRILIPQDFETEDQMLAALEKTRENIW